MKARGMKFVTILDPCISIGEPAGTYRAYDLGNEMDVWTKKANGEYAIGRVWPEDPTVFPDYSKPECRVRV
jgi:alpha-glucosidase (family GH31 glycosyl hydrolase)